MQINVEPRENFYVLHLRGEFDTFYCSLLQKEVDALLAAGVTRVALNLRLVKFINSTALGGIIRASKALTKAGGKLVISRPSKFCRDIIEKVVLDRVVPIYDTDEDAGRVLTEGSGDADDHDGEDILDDETTILFSPSDKDRIEHYIPAEQRTEKANPVHGHAFGSSWRGVGRMSALDADGLRFIWNGGNSGLSPFEMGQMLSLGTNLNVKFRLPLLRKGHCEAVVTVSELEERPDGVKLAARFAELEPETRTAVEQYAQDMTFLKKELRKATEE